MITAAEALAFPAAQVSESDLAVVREFLIQLDAHVRQHMTSGGAVVMEFDPRQLNTAIMMEIGHELRRCGWVTAFEERRQRSDVLRGQEVVVGHQISIAPTDVARDEHVRVRHAASTNGATSASVRLDDASACTDEKGT